MSEFPTIKIPQANSNTLEPFRGIRERVSVSSRLPVPNFPKEPEPTEYNSPSSVKIQCNFFLYSPVKRSEWCPPQQASLIRFPGTLMRFGSGVVNVE